VNALKSSLLLILPLWISTGCQSISGVLYQASTHEHLEQGGFRGVAPVSELKAYGDMGIGTFDRHNGSLILINGDLYQVTFNGDVKIPANSVTTPYAVSTRFEPTVDREFNRPMTLQQLEAHLDQLIPDRSTYCVFYIRGNFRSIRTRVLPPQTREGITLEQARARQSVFEFNDEYGTLVGIRVPPAFSGINRPGYQFHFLNEARNGGGEVVDLLITGGRIRADTRHQQFVMTLPD
jgi:acetolactate decarboxylase